MPRLSSRLGLPIVVAALALTAGLVLAFRPVTPPIDPATQKLVGSYDGIVGPAVLAEPGSWPFPTAKSGEHPLAPVLRWAKSLRGKLVDIQDYTATMVKRERVGKKLLGPEHMALKLRHKPFSVYLRFLAPPDVQGREVIYVAGRNHDKFQVHLTGFQQLLGTIALKPDDPLALTDNRHPITETGVLNLVDRLIEVGDQDIQHADCEVRVWRTTVQGNKAFCIQVDHPRKQPYFLFYRAKIYIDQDRTLPVRFESYDWPDDSGQPPLLEEYTYLDVRLNVGLTDRDFEITNPAYGFNEGKAAAQEKKK